VFHQLTFASDCIRLVPLLNVRIDEGCCVIVLDSIDPDSFARYE
jgi:hypothetical protein